MDKTDSQTCRLFAEAFRYPAPGRLGSLEKGLSGLKDTPEKQCLARFIEQIRTLSLGEWEELESRTLDLNPPAAPYIGFQTWGESYQRGEFLARMNREIGESGIDPDGELPDHLIPVLRYLAAASSPLPELMEVMAPAVQRMSAALRQADTANPYLFLLDGVLLLAKNASKEAV